ncbi:tRNA-splicing endonuclease subunit sen54 N-term-domain-containing protein [Dipodascopsis uninucleata]
MDNLDRDYEDDAIDKIQAQHDDAESDDEQQDWRLLDALANKPSLPKRGEKDYEPLDIPKEAVTLDASREAMYTALQGERRHTSKVHISGIWYHTLKKAKAITARGPHFKSIGKADSKGVIWLQPEEVIYLVERGSMTLYNSTGTSIMSLQACYSACLGACKGHERYLIYAYLKRLGYIVQRSATFDSNSHMQPIRLSKPRNFLMRIFDSIRQHINPLFRWAYALFERKIPAFGPIISPGAWYSYGSIYKRLQIIPYRSYRRPPTLEIRETPYRIIFDVWKPRPSFKKSNPGVPDFRIVVINSYKDKMPTMSELDNLFASLLVSNDLRTTTGQIRLRNGYKNVIFGVVDCGIISFLTFGDVSFGDDEILSAIVNRQSFAKRPPSKRARKD